MQHSNIAILVILAASFFYWIATSPSANARDSKLSAEPASRTLNATRAERLTPEPYADNLVFVKNNTDLTSQCTVCSRSKAPNPASTSFKQRIFPRALCSTTYRLLRSRHAATWLLWAEELSTIYRRISITLMLPGQPLERLLCSATL